MVSRKLKYACAIVATLFVIASSSFAGETQESDQKTICSSGGQSDMNFCMVNEYKKADAIMQELYSQLILKLVEPEGVMQAQSAWESYRDAECSNSIFQLPKPNSLFPLMVSACKRSLTLERIKRLQKQLSENCNGCPLKK